MGAKDITDINAARKRIDVVDEEIVSLLAKRISLCRAIAKIKNEKGMAIHDGKREQEVLARAGEQARKKGIDEEFVAGLYSSILENSRNEQSK